MSLKECVGLWGESHLMYGDPPLRVVPKAIFVPLSEKTKNSWGLYDATFDIIREGLDRRGAAQTPHYDSKWIPGTPITKHHGRHPYIYCGAINPHFGHFIINSLPKFWPYFTNKFGRPKILTSQPTSNLPDFAKTIFTRLEIGSDDFVCFGEATEINDVIVPDSCILEQFYIYTVFKDLCKKIAAAWWGEVDIDPTPAYISKNKLTVGVGRFLDEGLIEQTMREAGLDIIYPETMSIVDQVRLFTSRRFCVGPIGSAFHTTIFAPKGRKLLCYSPIARVNSNFDLIDKLNGNDASYLYQEGAAFEHYSGGFLTSVRLADPRQLAHDFLDEVEQRSDWRRQAGV